MANAELSVVLVNKFGLDRLIRVFASLAEQSIADRLEIVVVSPFDPPAKQQSRFAAVEYVKCGSIGSLGEPRAAGVRACSAPFLVFGEDHCFPRPGWAETLLTRLREGWTGVGPAILNHNPSSWISRADWLLNYGCFSEACAEGPASNIPPHNSAYRTAALLALDADLPALLQMDHHLQSRLLAEGGRFFLEPSAQAEHTNLSRLVPHWQSIFFGNRVYGATRARIHHWPAHRRGIYAAAFPLIAALRLIRACAFLKDWRSLPMVPLVTIGAVTGAAGEVCGYVFGDGSSLRRRVDEELDRLSGVRASDRALLLP